MSTFTNPRRDRHRRVRRRELPRRAALGGGRAVAVDGRPERARVLPGEGGRGDPCDRGERPTRLEGCRRAGGMGVRARRGRRSRPQKGDGQPLVDGGGRRSWRGRSGMAGPSPWSRRTTCGGPTASLRITRCSCSSRTGCVQTRPTRTLHSTSSTTSSVGTRSRSPGSPAPARIRSVTRTTARAARTPSTSRGPGLLAGGPDRERRDPLLRGLPRDTPPAKLYLDEEGSFASNEIAINWNAPLVFVLAGLQGK